MIDIRELLFWISLIFSMVLLIWNVFGNSPSEFIALVAIMFTILIKMSNMSNSQVRLETRFNHLAKDFKELSNDFKEHIKYHSNASHS